jgi:outer membrane protein assembly factor BamA
MDVVPEISGSADVADLYGIFNDRLVKFNADLIYDSLNDLLVPGQGFMFKVNYETSDNNLGSDKTYNKIEISFDAYKTFFKDHIIGVGYSHLNSIHLPAYKMFYFGGPDEFWGIDYNQAFGSRFNIGRIDYLFHVGSQIYAHGVFNFAFDFELYPYNEISQENFFSGYGAGIKMKTIFGVLEVMYARGDESIVFPGEKTNRLYFTAGFKI